MAISAHKAKKSLGQHFLMHPAIARRIAHVADFSTGDTVLEVGPGKGILTRALLDEGARVVAVEVDEALIGGLQKRFADEIAKNQLELVHADIRDVYRYPQKYARALKLGYRAVANIPYYITGEIIRMFLESRHQPSSMTLLVQKEVAERISREKKGNVLALSVKAYGEPRYEFTVPRGAFVPVPGVDSAVLSIRDISRRRFASAAEEERFFALIHAGFAHKRKYLRSNLATSGLPSMAIPEQARAEDLTIDDWLALVRAQ